MKPALRPGRADSAWFFYPDWMTELESLTPAETPAWT
jgi:hypothetical protein